MSDIAWTLVESTNIVAIGYDVEEAELHVQFNSGTEYVYLAVEPEVVAFFLNSPSKGRYLNDNIKGKYEYRRVV